MRGRTGFTIVEVLVASLITSMIVAAILAIINPMQAVVRAQGDASDLHQRLRAAADALSADVRTAVAVRPYRVGAVGDDGAAGIYYRADAITLIGSELRTYYWKRDTSELMQYDGEVRDFPMLPHIVSLAFDYFGGVPLARIEPATLADGPWSEDSSRRRFDNDLMRIRLVRATIRFESTAPFLRRLVPDEEVALDVALRMAIGGR